jgi:uncharacterized protein (TIGR03067 family)
MKLRLLGLVVVGVLLAADDAKKDAKAVRQIEGTWKGVSLEQDGTENEDAKNFTVMIKDGKYDVKNGDEPIGKGKLKLDPTKKPKAMDIEVEEGENAGQTELGIYEIKGDTLRICFAPPDKPRPKKFSAKEGTGYTLVVLKRTKS